jgi:hypothetical protein
VNRHLIPISIFLLLLAAGSWAQEPSANPPQTGQGAELPYTEVLTPPMPVSGVRMPLTFAGEVARSNFVTGGVQLSAAYDDNILFRRDHHIGDASYLFAPSLEIGQSRARWQWSFGYSPGFTVNQRFSERNQAAHSLHLLTGFRPSPHVSLQLHNNFEKTNTLFSDLIGNPEAPGPGALQQPNVSLVTPLANLTSNSSGLDLTYQFSPSSMVGASGGYSFRNYGSLAGTTTSYGLFDSRSWMTDGFYAHRFANRHWTGFSYNFQRLMFDLGSRTDVNRILWFYSAPISSHMTISIWAGPEYSKSLAPLTIFPSSPGVLFSHSGWAGAGGVSWIWQGSRTSFRLGYTQQTSDGGGWAEAVRMQSAEGELRRQLAAKWALSVGGTYGKNDPLRATSAIRALRSWMANGGFDYQMRDNLGLGLRYGRDQLSYAYPGLRSSWGNRNRVSFSLSYSFTRPLGR